MPPLFRVNINYCRLG